MWGGGSPTHSGGLDALDRYHHRRRHRKILEWLWHKRLKLLQRLP